MSFWEEDDDEAEPNQFNIPELEAWEAAMAQSSGTTPELEAWEIEERRLEAARRRGLPETATWEQIADFNQEQRRKRRAIKAGLPETATEEEIEDVFRERHRQAAAEAGLSETATPVQIGRVFRERKRLRFAALLGLDPSMSWFAIEQHKKDWRHRRHMLLMYGLPYTHTEEEFHNRYHEREPSRLLCIRTLGLPDIATWEEVDSFLFRQIVRLASKYGRWIDPKDPKKSGRSHFQHIGYILNERDLRWNAYRLGIPIWLASRWLIEARYEGGESEELRCLCAIELGLPDAVTWGDIENKTTLRGLRLARMAGLPETAPWNEVIDAVDPLIHIKGSGWD